MCFEILGFTESMIRDPWIVGFPKIHLCLWHLSRKHVHGNTPNCFNFQYFLIIFSPIDSSRSKNSFGEKIIKKYEDLKTVYTFMYTDYRSLTFWKWCFFFFFLKISYFIFFGSWIPGIPEFQNILNHKLLGIRFSYMVEFWKNMQKQKSYMCLKLVYPKK